MAITWFVSSWEQLVRAGSYRRSGCLVHHPHHLRFLADDAKPQARGNERYAVVDKPKTVEWASQNMLVLGIVVIVGLGLHLVNFWAKMQLPELMHNMGAHADMLTLAYAANGVYHIQNTFSNPVFVVLYLIWLGALWFHLTHGFWSSMQSLGWNNKVWINRWKCISNIYSTIVVVCFALVVVVFFIKSLMCSGAC
mgnify:CR=1 FL=1